MKKIIGKVIYLALITLFVGFPKLLQSNIGVFRQIKQLCSNGICGRTNYIWSFPRIRCFHMWTALHYYNAIALKFIDTTLILNSSFRH